MNCFFPVKGFGNQLNHPFPAANTDKGPVQWDENSIRDKKIFSCFDGSIKVDNYVNGISYH
jgi:hypothetical protein